MKRIVALCICLAVLLGTASCKPAPEAVTTEQEEVKQLKIGVVNFKMNAPYFVAMSRAIEAEAPYYENLELVVTDAMADMAKVTSDVEDLVAQGVDGVVMNAGPIESLPAAMDALNEAGIPVVLVNRKLVGSDYTSWIGCANWQIGQQDGQYIADRLGGEGVLLHIRGGPEDNTTGNARGGGMLSSVEPTNIEVITAPEFGGWTSDGGFKIMEDMLASYDHIDAVFCENDSMCLGAMQAIADAGRSDEMFLCGVDGEKEALKLIMEGSNYACTGLNDADQIGRMGFHRLLAILAGAVPEKDTELPSPLITKDNACQHYDPDSTF